MESVYCAVRTGSLNKAVCCIYLRTNSVLCHLQHKLIGFYNRDKKCLLRGSNAVLRSLLCKLDSSSNVVTRALLKQLAYISTTPALFYFLAWVADDSFRCVRQSDLHVTRCITAVSTRVLPNVTSNFFFACELGTADDGECGGRWNQLLCYP